MQKIYASICLMEGKEKYKAQRKHAHQNPKRHISPVSLLLCQKKKNVAVNCFVWALCKVIFVAKYVSRIVFEGSILGGA